MKKKKRYIALKIILIIVGVLGVGYGSGALANSIITSSLIKYAKSFDEIEYLNRKLPQLDDDNNYYFKTDEKFKIMHLSDIHIGSGFLSERKDKMALNAIASMVSYEKPDLVVITGDISFPVPPVSGSFNDAPQVEIISNLFEKLGVYWTIALGNHDSESYSYYNRSQITNKYLSGKYKYCLFKDNYTNISGKGNQIINIYNNKNLITKTLYIIDSNSYLKNDPLGIKRNYDNVHKDQIEWYKTNVDRYSKNNIYTLDTLNIDNRPNNKEDYQVAQSFVFQHIPLEEYNTAYTLYEEESKEVVYNFGIKQKRVAYPIKKDNFFETMVELKSTKAMFCGHDHTNTFSIKYQGIDLTYAMSIDYLAYFFIDQYGLQRGCNVINVNNDTSYSLTQENYYQDKYVSKYPKEKVKMGLY